jgi:hypothetical protein
VYTQFRAQHKIARSFVVRWHDSAVLWIRIRNNPNFLAGSESEKKVRIPIRIRIQTLLQDENFSEKSKIKNQTLEREKSYAFLLKICFLLRTGFRTRMKALRGNI